MCKHQFTIGITNAVQVRNQSPLSIDHTHSLINWYETSLRHNIDIFQAKSIGEWSSPSSNKSSIYLEKENKITLSAQKITWYNEKKPKDMTIYILS
jgi:hypothetical protein